MFSHSLNDIFAQIAVIERHVSDSLEIFNFNIFILTINIFYINYVPHNNTNYFSGITNTIYFVIRYSNQLSRICNGGKENNK